ncbi:hypothetical protein [Fonticella tunisiensis]|uniref:Uncharacterized protein n=1 Tax=Fonticella tunisiensis TaxID=1096341 RepID=A0A4R7KBX3_9CLOT|nr:hypothetical protein [Fonticella tunisiensis]TDT51976.1 hypothetical protein EDD71_1157 [Fonticella tunisiensis]
MNKTEIRDEWGKFEQLPNVDPRDKNIMDSLLPCQIHYLTTESF